MSTPWVVCDFVVFVVLTSIPIIAAALVALRCGVTHRLLLLGFGVSGTLVSGYSAFWVYFLAPAAGRPFSVVMTAVALVVIGVMVLQLRSRAAPVISVLAMPMLVWSASALLVLSLGALYGSTQGANVPATRLAATRFSHPLPIDNAVPLTVSRAVSSSHRPVPSPLYGRIWRSSDRPPLQSGVYLAQQSLLPGHDANAVHYQIVGVLLQTFWVFGVWALLSAIRSSGRLAALVLAATLFSGFVVVNSYFAWPKLFAAGYVVLLAAMLLTPVFSSVRTSIAAGLAAGALAAGGLLAHQGSSLGLIALVLVMSLKRRFPSREFVLAAVAVVVVFMGTWSVYQRRYDPPGDELLRHSVASTTHSRDPRPLPVVIASAYESRPFGTIVDNKLWNLATPFRGPWTYMVDSTELVTRYFRNGVGDTRDRRAIFELRALTFYFFVPSLGFLSLGFLAWWVMLVRRRRHTLLAKFAGTLWLFIALNLVTWALVLFEPRTTVLHAGTYATTLLGIVACVVSLWDAAPKLAAAVVALQVTIAVLVYGLSGPLPTKTFVNHSSASGAMLVLTIVAVALVIGALSLVATRAELGGVRSWAAEAEGTPVTSDT
jgi:hypothetical protein